MAIKNNKYYWNISLTHPEPATDDYYIFDKIIVDDKKLIQKIERLRELIISYCVIITKDRKASSKVLEEIYNIIISIDKIQYTEFVAFWKSLDISYSIFKNLPNQKLILEDVLQKYCEKRRKLYDKLGYSNLTVQALYDNSSSRKTGTSGIKKLVDLIEKIFISIPHIKDLKMLNKESTGYFLPDKGDKSLFENFCNIYNLKYEFSKDHQGKEPDMVFKINNHFFIIEAKHIKEFGGAQAKQIVEIIEFVGYTEKNNGIHFLSFMDGLYFNNFIWLKEHNNYKINKQLKDIEKSLDENKNNFFVNTTGFKTLLKDLYEGNKKL